MMKYLVVIVTIFVLVFGMSSCTPKISLMDLDEWDLVWISDSSGWGVADVYADMIEEDTGKKVIVHDNWMGGLAAGKVYNALKGEPTPSFILEHLADQISEAEVVVIYGNPTESEYDEGDWMCFGENNYVNNCEMETFETYIEHLEGIYQIIFELRDGKPTIVRGFDAYNPHIAHMMKSDVYEECKACWGNYNAAMHQAAKAFNVPVAEVGIAWNGENWDEDPQAKGYTKDGEHPNETGIQVIAQALRELGYQPVNP